LIFFFVNQGSNWVGVGLGWPQQKDEEPEFSSPTFISAIRGFSRAKPFANSPRNEFLNARSRSKGFSIGTGRVSPNGFPSDFPHSGETFSLALFPLVVPCLCNQSWRQRAITKRKTVNEDIPSFFKVMVRKN
jgi:hypothetical protein